MKVSLNTVKQYINFDLPDTPELVARINAQLGGVEEVIELGQKYADALIVRVVGYEKHPDADKLNVCRIDDGGVRAGVERDADGYVQVVCGASNVETDMWAVWLPPEATVPSTFDDAEPFVLGARKLRGVMSYGMLAGGDEIAINDDHSGIVSLTERDMPTGAVLAAGASFAEVFGLNDTIIDIENKMFTHRPDCFGQLGVAREIAGIFGQKFESPEWYTEVPHFTEGDGLSLEVFHDAGQQSKRFMAVAMDGVQIAPSPMWLQTTLVRWGSKAINNVVDATNYIMLLTAQPVHAYDYDKLRGQKLGVRMARADETVTLLNDKTYTLTPDDIVIADGEGVVGLAGIMGGGNSEVSDTTKRIVLEVAHFDMYAVRKTAMRHGVFTDALTRFNKGQSPLQCNHVLAELMQQMASLAGARQASSVSDKINDTHDVAPVVISSEYSNARLGLEMTPQEIADILHTTELATTIEGETLTVQPPFWRTDIELKEDIIEEIGRLYGFDKLPIALPQRSTKPAPLSAERQTAQAIRRAMQTYGANELLTYNFVHERTLKNAGQDVEQAFKLGNALSPDLQYYRLTVLPSLLEKVHPNIKAGHDEFMLYELGKAHNKKYHRDDDEGLPSEMKFFDAVYASKTPREGAAYYHVRSLIEAVASEMGAAITLEPADVQMDFPVTAPFDLNRSAMVKTADGDFLGMIGELKASVVKKFKLPEYTAAFTGDLGSWQAVYEKQSSAYVPLSRYPSISQDISLRGPSDVSYTQIAAVVQKAANETSDMRVAVELRDIYQAADDDSVKTFTFRLTCVSDERTLTKDDIAATLARVCNASKLLNYDEQ